jgi:hypothetical protein
VLLPRAIATLAETHPDLRVTTQDMEPEDSLPALKLGELDLALAQEYAFAPNPADPALERTDLLDDRSASRCPSPTRWPKPSASTWRRSKPSRGSPATRALSATPSSSTRRAPPATSRDSRTSPTTSTSRTRSCARAPASGSCPSWPGPRRPA